MRIILLLIAGALLAVTAGVWIFYDQLVLWVPALIASVKGLTLKSILAWLVLMGKKFLTLDLPRKYLVPILLPLMLSSRMRRRLRTLQEWFKRTVERIKAYGHEHHNWLMNRHVVIGLLIVVFIVGGFFLGVWVLLLIDASKVLGAFRFIGNYVFVALQRTVFRLIGILHLEWLLMKVKNVVPLRYRHRLRVIMRGHRRAIVRRRIAVYRRTAALQERIRRTKKTESLNNDVPPTSDLAP